MKLKNKILILLFIIISLFLIINNKSFAATTSIDSYGDFSIPDTDLTWYSIKENLSDTQINFINSYTSFLLFNDTYTPGTYSFYFINDYTIKDSVFSSEGACIQFNKNTGNITLYRDSYTVGYNVSTIILSNFDIVNNEGEVLFQNPLLVPTTTILAPIVEETETQKTLAEVVGILPLIIVVVVSLVGLRKALRMLSALLHRS